MLSKCCILIMAIALIGVASATSEYCTPSEGTETVIETAGTWTNVTIYGECPICVQMINGLECIECEGEPTPTPTPTPTVTPTPEPTVCGRGIWCIFPDPIPTPEPTPERWCPIGTWCEL